MAQIRALNGVFTTDSIIQDLTIHITDAVERCLREVGTQKNSTLALITNLRFIFETCISTRLLNLEANYKFKIRFSIYRHQLEKSKSLGVQARSDLARLKTLAKAELDINRQFDISENFAINKQRTDDLYEELNNEISVFLDAAESFGTGMLSHYIDQYLLSHSIREKEIEDEWSLLKKELIQDPEAVALFDFKGQTSRVDKELTDKRSWKDKAAIVGLGRMHDFLYDYTSSIMHSTSYSLMLPYELEPGEQFMIEGLAARFTYSILSELCSFAKIPREMVVINFNEGA
ncbi:hypothetical protein [Pseudomonas sp. S2_H01]